MLSLDAYCQCMCKRAGELKYVDAPVTNQCLVLQLVRGLPLEYDTVASYCLTSTRPTRLSRFRVVCLSWSNTANRLVKRLLLHFCVLSHHHPIFPNGTQHPRRLPLLVVAN
ncbi:hypothetical protein RND81_11G038900 [Saponaria officinalis]|uniref:Uncharacterized protein n=1 Tax=Saponaria officinalis TaxID=3572 RepID=A0AAW1HHM6_SAPOF